MTIQSTKKRNILLSVFILSVFTVSAGLYLTLPSNEQSTEDAYVMGKKVIVTSTLAGTIGKITSDETQTVQQGTTLILLSNNEILIATQAAEANVEIALRQVNSNYLKIDKLSAQISAEKIKLSQVTQDYKRRIGGDKDGTVLPEVLMHAKKSVAITKANLRALHMQLAADKALLPAINKLQTPQVQLAISQLRKIYLAKENASIVAPISGVIANKSAYIGQQIKPGQPLMTIVPLHNLWIEANFKETQLKNIRPGQSVNISSDLYGEEHNYNGIVVGIHAGTGNVFSAIPAQNATGNWIKIIQRIPVRIYINPSQLKAFPLRIGMSMKVTVKTNSQPKGSFDADALIHNENIIGSYQQKLARVDTRVAKLIKKLGV
ncbi:multidrug resistance protein [Psychromonas sp. CNPT3]|uniref:efflux RND transporter periplasmic adaptor subunit n=1 Tax=Psychromonas sp. CNPT3 TaxID=314282 RepID=UPI00006E4809|nr:efflux RND transporter periplasmic adaptor subunit [Psychromonas sp. CNPT3]AGH81254.1 multidrug resistance protein [Psychromonas sp. CNPT3]